MKLVVKGGSNCILIARLICSSIRVHTRIRKYSLVDRKGGCTSEGDPLGGTIVG